MTVADAERKLERAGTCVLTDGVPAGDDLDVTTARRLSLADAYARFRRAAGDDVLFATSVAGDGDRARAQLERLGVAVDRAQAVTSSEPAPVEWSQWLFLHLRERGLLYWVEQPSEVAGWHLRLRDCHEENAGRLAELHGWSEPARAGQAEAIGRLEGVEVQARRVDGSTIAAFTPWPERIADAEFVALSPNHPDVEQWVGGGAARLPKMRAAAHPSAERSSDFRLIDTGLSVSVGGVARPLPVIVWPAVDGRFGPTAILGIPAADALDKRIARDLPSQAGVLWRAEDEPAALQPAVRFRGADAQISIRRGSGPPVPLVRCKPCGTVAVPLSELPLGQREDECPCPSCGEPAKPDASTLTPDFVAVATAFLVTAPAGAGEQRPFDPEGLAAWLPTTLTVRATGADRLTLTERAVAKALRDAGLGVVPDGELHGALTVSGPISSHGEPPGVPELVSAFGADAVRFALLYGAAPPKTWQWEDRVLRHCATFLGELERFARPRLEDASPVAPEAVVDDSDRLRRRLASWCRTATWKVTENLDALALHRATRNAMTFLDRIQDFEARARTDRGDLAAEDREAVAVALMLLVRLLAPVAPHLAEELWRQGGGDGPAARAPWPEPAVREPLAPGVA